MFLKWDSLTPLIFYTCFLYKDHILDFATILEGLKLNLGSAKVFANRIFMLTDNNVYETDMFGDKTPENYSGKISFENVSFGYTKDKKVLDSATFEILPKQTVAFVGPLSDMSFANIFSQSVAYLIILLTLLLWSRRF